MSTPESRSHSGSAASLPMQHRVTFSFEGRTLQAAEGQSVASALVADGVSVFGRSSKYHRPRGYRCGRGYCSCCSMRVNGLPGVRACMTTVSSGMTVEREHSWPTADYDALRAAELMSPLMPPGFYYRWFRRSPRLWSVFERGLARVAGQGKAPSPEAVERIATARCSRKRGIDVLVVGGGVAGLSAALAAAEEGAKVLLVQRSDDLGGGLADSDDDTAVTDLQQLSTNVKEHLSIDIILGGEAIGWYEEGTIAVTVNTDLVLVDPAAVVLATGAYELGMPFPNCDLPGVMLGSGARRLLRRHGVRPGSTAVVVTRDDFAYGVALQLAAAGIKVACVADVRPSHVLPVQGGALQRLRAQGVTIIASAHDLHAHGFTRVSSMALRTPAGSRRRYRCDLVCMSGGFRAADDLRYQALSSGAVTLSLPAGENGVHLERPLGLWVVGPMSGATSYAASCEQGQVAGREAARLQMSSGEGQRTSTT